MSTSEPAIQEIDLDKLEGLSIEEIRKLAETSEEQPRGDDGKFIKKEEVPEPVKFRREIDLGDGSGKQVFEADSQDELIDKLTEAQKNATKKIRELAAATKQPEPAKEPAKPLTAEERLSILETKLKQDEIATQFIADHPDYLPNPSNGRRLLNWLKAEGLAESPENLHRAYEELNTGGLLEKRPSEDEVPEEIEEEPEPAPRIVVPVAAASESEPPRQKVSSGLSNRRGMAARAAKVEPTQEELESMPLDKLRELANQSLRSE